MSRGLLRPFTQRLVLGLRRVRAQLAPEPDGVPLRPHHHLPEHQCAAEFRGRSSCCSAAAVVNPTASSESELLLTDKLCSFFPSARAPVVFFLPRQIRLKVSWRQEDSGGCQASRDPLPCSSLNDFRSDEPPPHQSYRLSVHLLFFCPPAVFCFSPTQLNQYLTYSAERQDILEGPAPPPPPFFNVNLAALGKKRALLSEEDQQQQQDAEATEVEAQLAAAAAAEAKRRKELVELIARERDAVLRTGKTPEPFEPGSPEAIFEQHILKMILEGQNCGNGPELIKGSAAHQEITAQQNMARRVRYSGSGAAYGADATAYCDFCLPLFSCCSPLSPPPPCSMRG